MNSSRKLDKIYRVSISSNLFQINSFNFNLIVLRRNKMAVDRIKYLIFIQSSSFIYLYYIKLSK